jgi:hypothetical protein
MPYKWTGPAAVGKKSRSGQLPCHVKGSHKPKPPRKTSKCSQPTPVLSSVSLRPHPIHHYDRLQGPWLTHRYLCVMFPMTAFHEVLSARLPCQKQTRNSPLNRLTLHESTFTTPSTCIPTTNNYRSCPLVRDKISQHLLQNFVHKHTPTHKLLFFFSVSSFFSLSLSIYIYTYMSHVHDMSPGCSLCVR